MKALILVVALLLALEGVANARLTLKVYNSANSGGGSVAPSCTNGANFSQACNSAIAATIIGGFL